MKMAMVFVLVVHGLIHLMGFAKAFGLAQRPALGASISRPMGLLWLAAAVLCVAAAVALAVWPRAFPVAGAVAAALSQAVIVSAWSDARFGTIANLLVAVVVVAVWAEQSFRRAYEQRAEAALVAAGRFDPTPVTEEEVQALPEAIARWLRWSGAVGKPRLSTLRLAHRGQFRASPSRGFSAIEGEYVITTRRPAFVWYGQISMAPGIHAAAIDSYVGERGRMWVKVMSLVTAVDAASKAIDASAFARCVAELSMTPTFYLDRERVRCEAVDSRHARCQVTDGANATAADIFVHEDGALDRIEVLRPYERDGRYTMERFTGRMSRPQSWGDRRLAAHLDGIWNLPEGDLHYVAFDVVTATFD